MSENDRGALSPHDAAEWEFPQDPQLSPAGDRVAFTLVAASRPDEHDRSSLWMLDLPSGVSRQFTAGPRSDSAPRWSPDGATIAFLSDRAEAGKKQVCLISAGGGEASPVTSWKGGVSTLQWSPDGTRIAFLGKDARTDEEEQREKERRDHIVRDRDFKYDRLYIVSPGGGEPRLVSREGETHIIAFDWLPDASGLVAIHVPSPLADDEGTGPSDIVRYDLADGSAPRPVMRLETGVEQVCVSPDCRWVAFRSKAGRVTVADQLWVVPPAGGERRLLTPGYEGTIDRLLWSPNGREVRFVAHEDLWGALRAIDVETGEMWPLGSEAEERKGSYDAYLSQNAAGSAFAVVRHFSDRPPNVWVGQVGGRLEERTRCNERLAAYRFSAAEPIAWESDGVEIHGLLHRPMDIQEGARCPLVVHVHGGPAWLWSDRFMAGWHDWAQLLAQRGYAVLLPNPRGSTGRGASYTDALVNDVGGNEFRDIMRGVDHVVGLGFVDADRLGIGGWSWGGYLTAWAVTQTDRFRCAVMGAGVSNLASDQGQNDVPRMNDDYFDVSAYEDSAPYARVSPVTYVRQAKTPTLILHGEKDERVAAPQAWEMYRGLTWAGVETELVTYPREGHPIKERAHQIDLLERVIAWYDRFLQPLGPGASG